MFGYVVPVRDALQEGAFEQFQGAYCGLCHALGRRYGVVARFALSYDLTFLALLLSWDAAGIVTCGRRCMASPFRKKICCTGSAAFSTGAGYSVILTWWKLRDQVADSGFFRGLGYRFLCLLFRRAYRRAAADYPGFDRHCRDRLGALSALEADRTPSLDRPADTFAAILCYGADEASGETRVLRQLLYHTGRWVYLIDAYDDLEADRRSGSYNPILERFSTDGALEEADTAYLRTTLLHSCNLIAAAYNLLPRGAWSDVLDNIVYLGFPAVTEQVLTRRWRRSRRPRRREGRPG